MRFYNACALMETKGISHSRVFFQWRLYKSEPHLRCLAVSSNFIVVPSTSRLKVTKSHIFLLYLTKCMSLCTGVIEFVYIDPIKTVNRPPTFLVCFFCRGGQVFLGPSAMSESSVRKSIMDRWLLCGCTGKHIKPILIYRMSLR